MHLVSSELRLGMTENPICIQKGFLEEAALRESLTGVGRSEPCVCGDIQNRGKNKRDASEYRDDWGP